MISLKSQYFCNLKEQISTSFKENGKKIKDEERQSKIRNAIQRSVRRIAGFLVG